MARQLAADGFDVAEHLRLVEAVTAQARAHHPPMTPNARPDPKPAKRTLDKNAGRKKLQAEVWCRCGCGQKATDRAHIVGRDLGGGDVDANLVPLAHECHMKIEDCAPCWEEIASRVRLAMSLDELEYAHRKIGADRFDRYWPVLLSAAPVATPVEGERVSHAGRRLVQQRSTSS